MALRIRTGLKTNLAGASAADSEPLFCSDTKELFINHTGVKHQVGGVVKVNSSDSTAEYLAAKLVEGDNITLTVLDTGGVKTVEISAAAGDTDTKMVKVNAAGAEGYLEDKMLAGSGITLSTIMDKVEISADGKTKVSSNDTSANFLIDKTVSTNGSVTFAEYNEGGNEKLDIKIATNIPYQVKTESDDTYDYLGNKCLGENGVNKSIYNNGGTKSVKYQLESLFLAGVCQGRLTLESGVPYSVTDQSAKSTLYWCPIGAGNIAIYSTGSGRWELSQKSQQSLALSGLTANLPYDVYMATNGTLQLVAWSSSTVRATALATQDGVYVRDSTKELYLGTIRTSGTTTTEDTLAKRLVWNYYNRSNRVLQKLETTDSWAYTTAAWRQARGSSDNQVEIVVGLPMDTITLTNQGVAATSASAWQYPRVGIGEDSTTTPEASSHSPFLTTYTTVSDQEIAHLTKFPAVGYHYYAMLEYGDTGMSFYGDGGQSDWYKSGLRGTWVC